MLSHLPFLLGALSVLVATAQASPVLKEPAILAPRQPACPTTSRWQAYSYTTEWLSTTTITNGWSSLGEVTRTKTESETRTIMAVDTVISPAVTTLPATTTKPVVASVTVTVPWRTLTETVTSAGHAPTSLCQTTTVTDIIPSTTTVTVTHDLLYDTTWESTIGHVSTETEVYLSTTTRTTTTPGSTTYMTTATEPTTETSVALTFPTVYSTVWAKGCESWACQL